MPAELIAFEVAVAGPLWDGRLQRAVDRAVDEAVDEVAEHGVGVVVQELGRVLQRPTGRYQGQIQVDRTVGTRITDGGIVYGPWLAGASDRNRSTRFKGYSHWRRAVQRLRRDARDIAQRVVDEHLRRL
jgi:hypothetical protein